MELIINIFSLVGSLALFLFGMKTMSEGLEKFAGDRQTRLRHSINIINNICSYDETI